MEIVETASEKGGQNSLSGGKVIAESDDKASAYKLQQIKGGAKELGEFMSFLEGELAPNTDCDRWQRIPSAPWL